MEDMEKNMHMLLKRNTANAKTQVDEGMLQWRTKDTTGLSGEVLTARAS